MSVTLLGKYSVPPDDVPHELHFCLIAPDSRWYRLIYCTAKKRIQLREYCARRGWEIAGEYVDHISGAKDKRPAILRRDRHVNRKL